MSNSEKWDSNDSDIRAALSALQAQLAEIRAELFADGKKYDITVRGHLSDIEKKVKTAEELVHRIQHSPTILRSLLQDKWATRIVWLLIILLFLRLLGFEISDLQQLLTMVLSNE